MKYRPKEINCKICNCLFIRRSSGNKFCSKECTLEHKRIQNRTVLKEERQQYQKLWQQTKGKAYRKIWNKKNRDKINARQRFQRYGRYVNKKGARSAALALGFKSMFEVNVSKLLPKWITYESAIIHFKQPEKDRKYLPDFKVKDNVYIEAKGRLTLQERQKHLWIKEQHPEITVHFLFANAFNKISKHSKTTYAAWADANGFEWADFKTMGVPKKWIAKC